MSETENKNMTEAGRAEAQSDAPAQIEAPPGPQAALEDYEEIRRANEEVKRQMRRHTRRSFLVGGAAMLVGIAGFDWLTQQREENGVEWPFRQMLDINDELARDYYSSNRLSPTLSPAKARIDRVNGDVGLGGNFDPSTWKLAVEGLAAGDHSQALTLEAIRQLPRVDMVTDLKCIEGWVVTVRWAGAKFTDFMAAYPPATQSGDPLDLTDGLDDLPPYVAMKTPDGGYYVGLDIESMLNPQTLLCYEMNGAPLTPAHGAPLRLVMPHKYGVKNIKRIGTIRYRMYKPADYWGEQGYDWYLGL